MFWSKNIPNEKSLIACLCAVLKSTSYSFIYKKKFDIADLKRMKRLDPKPIAADVQS